MPVLGGYVPKTEQLEDAHVRTLAVVFVYAVVKIEAEVVVAVVALAAEEVDVLFTLYKNQAAPQIIINHTRATVTGFAFAPDSVTSECDTEFSSDFLPRSSFGVALIGSAHVGQNFAPSGSFSPHLWQ
jgi:hypothetical protein